jgi:predicted outer membrane repeat protein
MENDTGISNNQAENGGAIYAEDSSIKIGIDISKEWLYDGTPLTEVRFVNNTALNWGGALYLEKS